MVVITGDGEYIKDTLVKMFEEVTNNDKQLIKDKNNKHKNKKREEKPFLRVI